MSDATIPTVPIELLAQQFLEQIARGVTLGDMLNLDARDQDVLYSVGHTLYTRRRYADAAQVFGFLALHNHLERRFVKAHAAALQMSGEYRAAITQYTMACVMDMTDPEPCFHTCECLLALGLAQDAADGLRMLPLQFTADAHAALRERAAAMLRLLNQAPAPAGVAGPCPKPHEESVA